MCGGSGVLCRVPGHCMSLVARAWLPDLCVPFLRQDRRVSATICRTMHVPPPRLEWHLSGLPLSQAPPINNLSFAEPPTRAALLEQWTLRNVTQDSSLPHASNTLAFRLRPMRPIVAGTPITIRGLRGLNLPTSPPYTPIQTSAASSETSVSAPEAHQSQWLHKRARGSSSRPGGYTLLHLNLVSRYHLPTNHSIQLSGLTGSIPICDSAAPNASPRLLSTQAVPAAASHSVSCQNKAPGACPSYHRRCTLTSC